VRLPLLSWSKTFQVPSQVQRKEPDQHSSTISLWIAHYRPTSAMKPGAMNCNVIVPSFHSASTDNLAFELRVLTSEIRDGTPLLNGVIRHTQLECLNPSLAFASKLPAQLQ